MFCFEMIICLPVREIILSVALFYHLLLSACAIVLVCCSCSCLLLLSVAVVCDSCLSFLAHVTCSRHLRLSAALVYCLCLLHSYLAVVISCSHLSILFLHIGSPYLLVLSSLVHPSNIGTPIATMF